MKKRLKNLILLAVIVMSFIAPFSIQPSQKIETLTVNLSTIYAQKPGENEVVVNGEVQTTATPKVGYLSCDFLDLACFGINFLQYIAVVGGNALVALAAQFMDFFLQHSIQSSSYRDAGFIEQGWEILRDVTNLAFIFALLYIAFNMVLGTGGGDTKKRLIKVILIALTINKSP